jgi:hypothetical protein
MPQKFEHFADQRRTDVYEDVSAYMQWGETFRNRFPALPQEGANFHFPLDYKLGYWDPSKTRWRSEAWERFRDPHRMTYRSYHEVQSEREAALEAVLNAARAESAVAYLDPEWVEALRTVFAPLRFAEWGVCMAQQYVARFAISGLIANCAVLQVFDELRHVQTIAEWTRELEAAHGGFADYRRQWIEEDLFQPLREYLERVAVVKDWGEVVVASNVLLEPLLQPLVYRLLSDLGNAHRDSVLPHLAYSLHLDEERHWDWARALVTMVHEHDPANREITSEWVERWLPRAEQSAEPFRDVFARLGATDLFDEVYASARDDVKAGTGLEPLPATVDADTAAQELA